MNAELPVVLEGTSMGALLVLAGDLPFNANWPMVGRFGVVALVRDFSSVLIRAREPNEDPGLEKHLGVLGAITPRPKDMVGRPGFCPRQPSSGWHHGQRLCLDDIHRQKLLQILHEGEGRQR